MVVSFDTQLSADSVEFCPIDGWTRFAAVGTYQVLEKPADAPASATDDADAGAAAGAGAAGPGATTNRTGRLLVFQVADADADGLAAADAAPLQVTKVFEQDTAAILDIKWSHQTLSDRPVAGLVTSTGDTVLLDMAQDGRMQPISTLHNGKDGVLNLSLDWVDRIHPSAGHQVVVSQSDGSLALHVVTPDSGISVASEWAAHSFEAWTTAFDGSNPHVVYSGGDDCLFQAWDTRTDLTAPLFRNKRHQAGVCSISPHPTWQHVLATGSYDDSICMWDTRSMRAPVSTTPTGGGVWRLRWHPTDPHVVLAACMYNGFHIFRAHAIEDMRLDHIGEHTMHKSIAYGADWSFDRSSRHNSPRSNIVGTCSFYDHLLTFWVADIHAGDESA